MGKTRDLFKKIRDTQGTFHAKMGSIKDRNGLDLTEAEDIKKRWQEYTEELYKKDLQEQDNHDGVITHLEPDILEYESSGPQEASLQTKLVEVRNRFKGLDLIDRVPEELWTEVHDIVQETGIKTIPMETNAKKQNGCLSRPYKQL